MNVLADHAWIILPLATLLSLVLGLLLIPISKKMGWVDHPGVRKVHVTSTPLGGGFAIFLTLFSFSLVFPENPVSSFWCTVVLVGAALILLLGAVDDRWGLSPIVRFLIQLIACLFVIHFTDTYLHDFGNLFSASNTELGRLALPITVFAALGVINAFNLIDGMDGLSGSLFLVSALGMLLFAANSGHSEIFWLLAITSACVLGYLVLNARFPWNAQARLFLGDAGSLMLGFILAFCFIRLGNGEDREFMPMTAVWLFAVPLLDTATLIWRRWREGRSAMHADQSHLHHVFMRAGFSVEATWGMIVLLAVLLASIGLLIEISSLPEWLSFYAFMLVAFSYYFYIKHAWATQCFLGRHFVHHDFEIDERYVRSSKT